MRRYVIPAICLVLLSGLAAGDLLSHPVGVSITAKDAANATLADAFLVYQFVFSQDTTCASMLNLSVNLTTDAYGRAYTSLDTSSLTSVPSYLCEYRNGTLRKTHELNTQSLTNLTKEIQVVNGTINTTAQYDLRYFRIGQIVNGTDGANWTANTTYPSSPATGDFFLNVTTGVYAQWNGSAWNTKGNLTGARGPQGETGSPGAPGQDGSNASVAAARNYVNVTGGLVDANLTAFDLRYLQSYTETDPFTNRSWNQTKADALYYPRDTNPLGYINTSSSTDLSSYVNLTILNTVLQGQWNVSPASITGNLTNYLLTSTFLTVLNGQNNLSLSAIVANIGNWTADKAGYVTSGALTGNLSSYVTNNALVGNLSSYATLAQLNTGLAGQHNVSPGSVTGNATLVNDSWKANVTGYYPRNANPLGYINTSSSSDLSSYINHTILNTVLQGQSNVSAASITGNASLVNATALKNNTQALFTQVNISGNITGVMNVFLAGNTTSPAFKENATCRIIASPNGNGGLAICN